jgi:hypothetical protein
VKATPQRVYAPYYAVQPLAQYFPRPPAPLAAKNPNKPVYKPPMGPPGGFPPPRIPYRKVYIVIVELKIIIHQVIPIHTKA